MYTDNFADAIKYCRFCFMCRHLSGIGNVTFTEADTPRVRASMIFGAVHHPENFTNEDLIRTMYRSDLSGACRRNCVQHFDEVGLTLAYRADIVEMGKAPESIKNLAAALDNGKEWNITGEGDVLYIGDKYSVESGAMAAFQKLVPRIRIMDGCTCGKSLYVLGFREAAKKAGEKMVNAIKKSGAKIIVVSNPAIYDMLKNTCPEMGLEVPGKVMHSSEYLLEEAGIKGKALGELYYLESDFLRNYNNDYKFPTALLEANGAICKPFGTNSEESYSCGEGALVLDRIEPALVEKLAKYIEARADDVENDVIVVSSPYTKLQLKKYTSLDVKMIEEVLAGL